MQLRVYHKRMSSFKNVHKMLSEVVDVVVCNELIHNKTASFRQHFKRFFARLLAALKTQIQYDYH